MLVSVELPSEDYMLSDAHIWVIWLNSLERRARLIGMRVLGVCDVRLFTSVTVWTI